MKTYVIGIGDGTASIPTLLNSWADAGHTARTGATHYYQTNSPADLKAAFDAIVGGIVSCDFKMSQTAPDPTLITVTENGSAVSPSPTNGYTYDATDQHGDAARHRVRHAQEPNAEHQGRRALRLPGAAADSVAAPASSLLFLLLRRSFCFWSPIVSFVTVMSTACLTASLLASTSSGLPSLSRFGVGADLRRHLRLTVAADAPSPCPGSCRRTPTA